MGAGVAIYPWLAPLQPPTLPMPAGPEEVRVREFVLWSSHPMPHSLLQEGLQGLHRTVRALGETWGAGGARGLAAEAGAQVTMMGI